MSVSVLQADIMMMARKLRAAKPHAFCQPSGKSRKVRVRLTASGMSSHPFLRTAPAALAQVLCDEISFLYILTAFRSRW